MQPSLFGVEATDPSPADLAGLLAGPGRLGTMGGTVRISVPVDAAWRVHALIAELGLRKLPASWEPAGDSYKAPGDSYKAPGGAYKAPGGAYKAPGGAGYLVRTAYTTRLLGLAAAWRDGPPAGLHLDGQAMRLWVAAAGSPSPDGFLLGLAADEARWPVIGAALAAAGLAAALVSAEPAYRITGRKRLARLAELVGDPPATAPADVWPARAGVPPGTAGRR